MNILHLDGPLQDRIKLDDEEINIIKAALKTKLFSTGGSFEERVPKFQVMLDGLAEKFNIPAPQLVISKDGEGNPLDQPGYGYNPDNNTISVGRLSLVSILNGFAVSLKNNEGGVRSEGDAEFVSAFALSAFKQAAPKMFALAVEGGRLMGVGTYTDAGRLPMGSIENPVTPPAEEPTFDCGPDDSDLD